MTHRPNIKWIALVAVSLMLFGYVVFHAAIEDTNQQLAQATARSQVISCQAGNVARGSIIIDSSRNAAAPAERQASFLRVYKFRYCPETNTTGRDMTPAERTAFLNELAKLMRVPDWDLHGDHQHIHLPVAGVEP